MIAFIPIEIETSELISSIAIDADSATYGASWKGLYVAGTYGESDVVYKGIIIYESLTVSNIDDPEAGAISDTPTWLELGKLNRWRAFDEYTNTFSFATDQIIMTLSVDNVDYLALFNLVANNLKIEMLNSANVVQWTYEYDLASSSMDFGDWWEYCYSPYPPSQRDIIVPLGYITSKPLGDKIKITLDGSGQVECGLCAMGTAIQIGATKWNPNAGALDFSKKDTDSFGRTSLKKGRNAKLLQGNLIIKRGAESYVYRKLTDLLGVAAVWDFNEDGTEYDPLIVFGFIQDFKESIVFLNYTECSISIEGLI